MFKEYWNGYLALGLIVGISLAFNIVGFLSVGADWIGLEKAATDTNTYAEQQCSRQQAEYARAGASLLPGIEASPAKPKTEEADPPKNAEPDWCDLAAQQGMADSTFGMEQAAWVALVLTAVGVVLVWRTLYYTRATLNEAKNTTKAAVESIREAELATKAANEAVKVAREMGEIQVRAYVGVLSAQIERKEVSQNETITAICRVAMKNFGQSPAHDVKMWVKGAVVQIPPGGPFQEGVPLPHGNLGPTATTNLRVRVAHTNSHVAKIAAETMGIYVWGRVTYVDAFSQPRAVTFKFVSAGTSYADGHLSPYEQTQAT